MDLLSELVRGAAVALGIGLVIFVHELGHFICCRLCKVRVEVFSIGFGPALLSWTRKGTLYKLAAIPLGGYVKMFGDDGTLRPQDELPPDSLPAKSVEARFLIYSGGVLMNVAFALVVFPILFAVGVPFHQPRLGESSPGGPAWHARLPAGAEVISVNGNEVFDFTHIPTEVALGGKEPVAIRLQTAPDGPVHEYEVLPIENEVMGFYSLEVNPALDPEGRIDIQEESAAWKAGLRSGDRLLSFSDAPPGLTLLRQFAYVIERGGPITLEIEGKGPITVTPEVDPDEPPGPKRLGVQPPRNLVAAVRPSLEGAGLGLATGDRVLALNGQPVRRLGDLQLGLLAHLAGGALVVTRDGHRTELPYGALTRDQALEWASDVALTSDTETSEIIVSPGLAADRAGVRDGDRVVRIDGVEVAQWSGIRTHVEKAAQEGRATELTIERSLDGLGGELELHRISALAEGSPVPRYGFALIPATYTYQVTNPIEAVKVGAAASWKFIEDSWLTIKGLLTAEVSTDNLGSIITIGVVSYQWAESGLAKLLFFLCMLSVNLAIINVLPIPVLDGGHLFFLLIEKVKGSPVSERVLGYSQMVGLVLILSLLAYVTYNDITRFILNP